MTVPLRIMLTADQKQLVDRAAQTEQLETAAWARPLLLQAAQAVIDRAQMLNTRRTKPK